jgi:hypothetical protein
MRTCKTCKVNKPFIEYRLKGKYYLRSCKLCALLKAKEWAKKNPGVRAAYAKKYREKYQDQVVKYHTQYRAENRNVVNQRSTEYRKHNPHVYAAHAAKRNAIKLQRTPAWLTSTDKWMIEEAYHLAALRTKIFGFSWHVDHIIPLQGKLVSGFNTPYNLQVIPATENRIKKNKFEVFV